MPTFEYGVVVGAGGTDITIDLDFSNSPKVDDMFNDRNSTVNLDGNTSQEWLDPELQAILTNEQNISNIVNDIGNVKVLKNSKSMDKMLDTLFFEDKDINYDNFDGTSVIDWENGGLHDLADSSEKQIFLAPLDPPIIPQFFPNFFSLLKKMGVSSFNYGARFIMKKDSDIVIPEYKFKTPKKENNNISDSLFADYAEEFTEVVDILNDFNPIKTDVNIPWDCGDDNKLCELLQLGMEIKGERRIENIFNKFSNSVPSYTQDFEDGTHEYFEVSTISDDMFSNSSSVTVEKFPNGDKILNTNQSLPIAFKPIKELPTPIKNDLLEKGNNYTSLINKSQLEIDIAKTNFDIAEQNTIIAHNDYSNYAVGSRSSPHYSHRRAKKNEKLSIYRSKKNIEVNKWNIYAKKSNKQTAIKSRRFKDIKTLLNKLVNDTCLSPQEIKDTVNNSYDDVLTDDATEIFKEHIDEKKIPTKCCLQVCLNPCKYKLEK